MHEAFELVSRQIDGDLSAAESARLAAFESRSPVAITDFRNRCLGLQGVLRQIPVETVENVLFHAPHHSNPLARVPGRYRKGVVWGSIAVVMGACVLLAIVRPWDASDSGGSSRSITSIDKSEMPGAKLDNPDFADRSVGPGMLGGSAEVAVASDESGREKGSGSDASIDSLLKSKDWNIVVVKVDVQDRDTAMERIRSIVHDLGYSVQNTSEDAASDFLGVVTTSAVAENEKLVSEMEKSVTHSAARSDSNNIAEARRQEIIADVKKSLQSPTRSELHHGMVYLALSARSSRDQSAVNADVAVSTGVSDRSEAGSDATVASSVDSSPESAVAERVGSTIPDQSVSGITLVVFEFHSDDKGTPSGESSEKQI